MSLIEKLKKSNHLKGDPYIWGIVFVLGFIGVLAVYSSTGTLAFAKQQGNTEFYLFRHLGFLVVGFFTMYAIHTVPFKFYAKTSIFLMWISVILLIVALTFGLNINNANRVIPIFGFTLQPSDMTKVFIMVFIAKFLSKNQEEVDNKKVFFKAMGPVLIAAGLIIPENLSTALVLITSCTLLLYIGRIKTRFILTFAGGGLLLISLFVIFLLNVDVDKWSGTRLPTWKARIESYAGIGESGSDYQKTQAKIAIATGGLTGKGPGHSTQRNFLPHPYSDFIFAIIVEEYGLLGGLILIAAFIVLLLRSFKMVVEAQKSFAALVVLGISFSMSLQAFIHMGVNVGRLPVTGLTLPLVSMGGTSIIFNSIAFGIILGTSRHIREEKLKASTQGAGAVPETT